MTVTIASPLTLPCGAVLPNRLVKAAMTEGLADVEGRVSDELVTLYRRWGAGGIGTQLTGNVMIDARYLERPGNVVIDHNGGESGLERLAAAGTAAGAHFWMQISHPGRQCSRLVNGRPVSASDVQLKLLSNFARPRAMTDEEIAAAIAGYARVAGVARRTGFTGVQIHAAHGYLISQFLSPITNRRSDRWGGPLENRARFLVETVRATRAEVGDAFPVAVKLNSADFQRGGFSNDDAERVAVVLEAEGIDLLEVSGGTYEQLRLVGMSGDRRTAEEPAAASTRRREAYFLDYTRKMRAATTLPLAVTGGFRSVAFMNEVLARGELDAVGIARPLCVEPDLPARMLAGELAELESHEKRLRLGPGALGPVSGITAIKALNAQAQVAWFYRQIIELAHDRPPLMELGAMRALYRHMRAEYRLGLRRRRHRRGRRK